MAASDLKPTAAIILPHETDPLHAIEMTIPRRPKEASDSKGSNVRRGDTRAVHAVYKFAEPKMCFNQLQLTRRPRS